MGERRGEGVEGVHISIAKKFLSLTNQRILSQKTAPSFFLPIFFLGEGRARVLEYRGYCGRTL